MAVKHRWVSIDGDMANLTSWSDGTVPATEAFGTLTLTGNAGNNQTVVIDVKTYTFKTTLSDTDGFVLIGGSASDSIDNLIAAITLGVGAGTLYAASTTLHPTVTAVVNPGDTLYAIAKLKGTDGNSIVTTETLSSGSWVTGTLLGATQWDEDDEIAVGMDGATVGQDFLTNLDWSITTTSPELRLARMNVDRTNIKFGGPGNPIKFSLTNNGALNYLGTGMMYADFRGYMNVYVDSLTSQQVLNLNVRSPGVGYVVINSGGVTIVAGAVITEANDSQIYTTGPQANLTIQGVDEAGGDVLVAVAGSIMNERRVLGSAWVIVLPDGTITQKGIMGISVTARIGALNLGGVFSYEPVNDPTTNVLEGRFLLGTSRFDLSNYVLLLGDVLLGAQANLLRGPIIPVSDTDIDLADDFPF